jgi:ADP-ribosylglycohydrolase
VNRPTIRWTEGGVSIAVGDAEYTAEMHRFPNGETDAYVTLAAAARQAARAGASIDRCASCARFRFSGMSGQMSAGRAGYCTRVGFRDRRALVQIDHGCGEHEPVAGWPDDLDQALRERLARSSLGPPDRLAAFEGALLGLAVGDALGFATEFRSREAIVAAFPPHGIEGFVALHDPRWPGRPSILGKRHPAGTFSDDTQMTMATAEALIASEGGELDAIMRALAEEFVRWSRSPDNDRAPGGTCMTGCANLEAGAGWRDAGVADSKGCGSAMRVAPIGLRFKDDRPRLLEVARASSLLTHGHPAAVESAAAAALLLALALDKRGPEEMHQQLVAECSGRSPDLAARLAQVPQLLSAEPALALSVDGLGEGWVAEEAVCCALWCFWRSPDDFRETVLTAANTDGDSDSIASIAGGISGAFNGVGAIPAEWRRDVEGAERLADLASRLWRVGVETRGGGRGRPSDF